VGDEIIAVWRPKPGRSRCLYAWAELCAILERRAGVYRNRYGLVPEFRLGLHAGTAVAGELGDSKKEIAYLGDTVNTASRILSACKDFNRSLLLSADALEAAEAPPAWSVVPVGRVTLRGKKRAVELFGLDPVEKPSIKKSLK
jgi:adenylate cyclase